MTPKEALEAIRKELQDRLDFPINLTPEYGLVNKALNELERLKKFKETFDNYELAKKQDFIAYENWLECEKELTGLKRDVVRYFELANNEEITGEVLDEFSNIRDKLMTVGKEDE